MYLIPSSDCRTDIDEAKVISFLGVRTDRQGLGILTWIHVGTQNFLTQSSKLGVSRRSLAICIPGARGCIEKASNCKRNS